MYANACTHGAHACTRVYMHACMHACMYVHAHMTCNTQTITKIKHTEKCTSQTKTSTHNGITDTASEALRTQGGIGLWLRSDEQGVVRIKRVLAKGPAALSGVIEVGDTLVEVDGKAVEEAPATVLCGLHGDAVSCD